MPEEIPVETLREILTYDPDTGLFVWNARSEKWFVKTGHPSRNPRSKMLIWNARFAGKPAMTYPSGRGYLLGDIFGSNYRAHRIAYTMFHGAWPDGDIDHINGVRDDNRIANLRIATPQENSRNKAISELAKSGIFGVQPMIHGGWKARIYVNGWQVLLGKFARFEDAVAVRKEAEAYFGFHPNHGRPA